MPVTNRRRIARGRLHPAQRLVAGARRSRARDGAKVILAAVVAGWLVGAHAPSAGAGPPEGGRWWPAGRLSVVRSEGSAVALADGRVLAIGGGNPQVASVDVFDPATGAWAPTGAMASPRAAHAAVRLADGKVLVSGGRIESQTLTTAEVFDPATGTWAPTGSLAVARQGHTANLLASGKVLVAGGLGGGHGPYLSEAELFDPATGTWAATGVLAQGRAHHTATTLTDGRVLVAGGEGAPHDASLRDSAVYDPATGTWTPVPSLLATGRADHTATAVGDGTVLVAGGTRLHIGGRPQNMLPSVEVLDRSGSTWLAGPAMAQRRSDHATTVLRDGRVLVTGGFGERIATATATAELYDPAARRWATAAPMPAPAAGHAAVVIEGSGCGEACGAVLVVGDQDAHLYSPPPLVVQAREGLVRRLVKLGAVVVGGVVPIILVGIVVVRRRRHRDETASGRGRTPPNQTLEHR
ncbi:MAG: Kelch repeat-containing protein [Actinomycetota bacterium]